MKGILLFFIITVLTQALTFGQKLDPRTICSKDTLIVQPKLSIKVNPAEMDSLNLEPYKIVTCTTRAAIGFRIEIAVSNYYYGEKTTSWIGRHGGPNINFILAIKKLNFGFRFKPWTSEPNKPMLFDNQILPINAQVNVVKIDYFIGYSFDFKKLISIEPYIGYNRSTFPVINEDDINQRFNLNKTGGIIIGTTINKYFKLKDYGYLSLFGTAGYGFVNYEKVHPDLDNGYFEWNLGIAYKGFATKRYNKKLE